MRPSVVIHVLSYILGTISLRKVVLSLLFCVILLGWVLTPSAEIYRWQDREGVIRYSNTPPDDQSLVIETIPTERIPLLEDENGMLYYLHVPEGSASQNPPSQPTPGQLALPPEVLDRLVQEASQTLPPSPDLTALTLRLAELERSLKQEMTGRQQWEQEYRQIQSYTQKLEQQNGTLQLALAEMQTKFEQLRRTVDASKTHIASLQRPDQEFTVIETKVAQLQTSVTDMGQHSQQAAEQVHTQVKALYARLENVEMDLQTLRTPSPVPEPVSASTLSQKLEELKGQLPHPQQFEALSQKFAGLESKLGSLDVEDQLHTISEKLHTLESQNMAVQDVQTRLASLETTVESAELQQHPDQELQGKLASLESNIETLREMIPSSQRSHEIVEKLLDNGSILKNVVAYQSEQLDAQEAQITQLEQELTRLKTTLNPDVPANAAPEPPSELPDDELTALLERQHVMETVIKQQANALMVQKERLDALEALLKQAQNKGMSAISRLDDQDVVIFEESPGGRILVVPRKERRTESKISFFDGLGKSFH